MHSRSVPVLVPLISHWFTAVCRERILVSLLQRESLQTDGWGAAEKWGMSHHREGCDISQGCDCPRLLHALEHTDRCREDKGWDVKLSLPPQG